MAAVALARWPGWYGDSESFIHSGSQMENEAMDAARIESLTRSGHHTSTPWLRAAVRECRAGRLPLPKGFVDEIHAAQLVRVLAPDSLVIALAVEGPQKQPDTLFYFAKAAEWIARETKAKVAALVPQCHAHAPELDAILYGAIEAPVRKTEVPKPRHDERPKLVVPPLIGHPHPGSPGEILLAQHLSRDTELGALFLFNQWVETASGERFLVDLVWPAGKLVVEVDGYTWHSSPHAFSSDRYRDYRLMLEGYLVLRLPHDEVMSDAAMQIDKIRDMVRFRRETARQ